MTKKWQTRGNYYATVTEHRDGKRFGREVARQARTFAAARKAVDATGLTGSVQCWDENQQRRFVAATKDEQGWYSVNPFDGTKTYFD